MILNIFRVDSKTNQIDMGTNKITELRTILQRESQNYSVVSSTPRHERDSN
jgi:hypothetical protein